MQGGQPVEGQDLETSGRRGQLVGLAQERPEVAAERSRGLAGGCRRQLFDYWQIGSQEADGLVVVGRSIEAGERGLGGFSGGLGARTSGEQGRIDQQPDLVRLGDGG